MHMGLLEFASKSATEIRIFEALYWGIFEFRSFYTPGSHNSRGQNRKAQCPRPHKRSAEGEFCSAVCFTFIAAKQPVVALKNSAKAGNDNTA